jgi:hypothetical protein
MIDRVLLTFNSPPVAVNRKDTSGDASGLSADLAMVSIAEEPGKGGTVRVGGGGGGGISRGAWKGWTWVLFKNLLD